MALRLKKIVTFANVVAMLALVVSLSGGVYAAGKINGKSIKKNSVTGKQVKESSLGTVPSASTLGGVGPDGFLPAGNAKRFRFERTVTTAGVPTPLVDIGTLRLTFTCNGVGGNWQLKGSTSASDASADYTAITVESFISPAPSPTINAVILSGTPAVIDEGGTNEGNFDRANGTIIYNSDPAHETTTVNLAIFHTHPNATTSFCYVAGTALRTTS